MRVLIGTPNHKIHHFHFRHDLMAAAASSSVALTLLPDYLQATASFLTRQGQQTLYLLHLVFPLSYFFGGCGGNKPVSTDLWACIAQTTQGGNLIKSWQTKRDWALRWTNLKWNCSLFLFVPFFPYRLLSVPISGFNSCRTRTSTTRLLGCIGPFAMRWPRRVVILAWGAKKSKFQRKKTVSWINPTSCVFVSDFGFHISTWFCVELGWGNYHKSNIVKLLVDAELWFIWFIHAPLNMWGKVPTSKRRRGSWNWFAPRDHFSPATCSHHSESQSAVDAWVSRLWSLNLLIYGWLLGPFVFWSYFSLHFSQLRPQAWTLGNWKREGTWIASPCPRWSGLFTMFFCFLQPSKGVSF